MAEIAIIDSKEGGCSKVFYDGKVTGEALELFKIADRRAAIVNHGLKKMLATDDAVIACCDNLAAFVCEVKSQTTAFT